MMLPHGKAPSYKGHRFPFDKGYRLAILPPMGDRKSGLQLLKDRLAELGLNQSELGQRIGASPPMVSRWMNATRRPSLTMAFRIQAELGVPADAWLDDPIAADADDTGKRASLNDEAAAKLAATGND